MFYFRLMKRFIAFSYEDYYPAGGLGDMVGDFDTIEEIIELANKSKFENLDILDLQTGESAEGYSWDRGVREWKIEKQSQIT